MHSTSYKAGQAYGVGAKPEEQSRWLRFIFLLVVLFALPLAIPLSLAAASRMQRAPRSSDSLGSLLRLKASVFAAALCHSCMTFSTCIMAGAFLYVDKDPSITTTGGPAQGAVTASLLLGALAGALSCTVVDAFGRRNALMTAMALYIAGSVVTFCAPTLGVLLLGRLVIGFGAGICSVFMNVYIAEIAPTSRRGEFTGWSPLLGSLGMLFSHVATAVLAPMAPLGLWRCQLLLLVLPSSCVLLLYPILVESPRWLLLRGRRVEAKTSILALFPQASGGTAEAETRALERDIGSTCAARQLTMMELIRKKPFPVLVGCGINALQQVCGINILMFFGPLVLKHAGLDEQEAVVATILVVACQSLGGFCAALLMDRLGRRRLTLSGMLVMMFGLLVLTASFAARPCCNGQGVALASVAGIILFRTSYAFSVGPLPHVMTAEIFSADSRAAGTALSLASYWASNFIVCQSWPVVEEILTPFMGLDLADAAMFAGFFCICAVSFVVVYRVLPETAGVDLEKTLASKPK